MKQDRAKKDRYLGSLQQRPADTPSQGATCGVQESRDSMDVDDMRPTKPSTLKQHVEAHADDTLGKRSRASDDAAAAPGASQQDLPRHDQGTGKKRRSAGKDTGGSCTKAAGSSSDAVRGAQATPGKHDDTVHLKADEASASTRGENMGNMGAGPTTVNQAMDAAAIAPHSSMVHGASAQKRQCLLDSWDDLTRKGATCNLGDAPFC